MGWTFYNSSGQQLRSSVGLSQATQAALEAETNEDTYVPPDLIKHSPGVAKVWCRINAAGTTADASYNVASIDDNGSGDRGINFTTVFSSSNYAIVGTIMADDDDRENQYYTILAGSVENIIHNDAGINVDQITGTAIFGDQ